MHNQPYNATLVADELEATALGHAYYGNALSVAKSMPGITYDERAVLDRFATGTTVTMDHVRLQDVANKVRSLDRISQ